MTIEERIQELRKSKGLSQEQLAEALNVSRQAVSKWESGQSLPEVDKLIAMGTLFAVTIDYILTGEMREPANDSDSSGLRLGAQVASAAATMLLLVAIFATFGNVSEGADTIDIFGGLVIESVGIMLILIGWFLAGGVPLNKPLLAVNILLAGVLPSLLFSGLFLQLEINVIPQWTPVLIAVFVCIYLLLCCPPIYFSVLRRKNEQD